MYKKIYLIHYYLFVYQIIRYRNTIYVTSKFFSKNNFHPYKKYLQLPITFIFVNVFNTTQGNLFLFERT